MLAVLPKSACGCSLCIRLCTLLGKRLSTGHAAYETHFEIFQYFNIQVSGQSTTLFHHSTNMFIKSLLFANYHVRPWGTKTVQGIEGPCPSSSMCREKTGQLTKKQCICNASSILDDSRDHQARTATWCAQKLWSQTCAKYSFRRY